MQAYKQNFVDFLLKKEALKIGEFKLKSGRMSPYFINTGMFDDGKSIGDLGHFYAAKIADRFKSEEFDIVFGPAYKGIPLAVETAAALSKDFNINKGYTFNRGEPKDHGEGTEKDIQKNWLVGHKISDGDRILILDDVITTGTTKYDAIDLLNKVAKNIQYVGLVIAVDRQEVAGFEESQLSAAEEFQKKTGMGVEPIVTINEIIEHLWDHKDKISQISLNEKHRLESYIKEFGTEEARRNL